MVRSCAASGCTNRDTKENRIKGIAFYRIPLKKDKRLKSSLKWLNALKRKDYRDCSHDVTTLLTHPGYTP